MSIASQDVHGDMRGTRAGRVRQSYTNGLSNSKYGGSSARRPDIGGGGDAGIQARTARMVREELDRLADLMGGSYEDAARRVGSATNRSQDTILRWGQSGIPSASARSELFGVFQDLEDHFRLVDRLTGDNLRRLRHQSGMHPDMVARMCGVRPRTYLSWERGEHTPQSESLARLKSMFLDGESTEYGEMSGAVIRWVREQLGWTQREMASALGTTHSLVSGWETGGRQVSRPYARRVQALMDAPEIGTETLE